jgi:hypothetical protein
MLKRVSFLEYTNLPSLVQAPDTMDCTSVKSPEPNLHCAVIFHYPYSESNVVPDTFYDDLGLHATDFASSPLSPKQIQ